MVTGFQQRTKGRELSENWYGRFGKSSATFGGGGNVFVSTALTPNSATNVSLALASYSMPGNALYGIGAGIYVEAAGSFAANAQAKSIELDIGGIKLNSGTSTSSGTSWEMDGTYFKTGANTQTGKIQGWIGSTRVPHLVATDTSTDTAAIVIALKALSGSASASDIQLFYMYVEAMNFNV